MATDNHLTRLSDGRDGSDLPHLSSHATEP
jgi:hypothetical protein